MSRIMAHMVPYYPDRERSMAVALGLAEGGAAYLEVQFPFSDPMADGPVIQAACEGALHAGFTVDRGFAFVRELSDQIDIPIFIMTYASLIFARGIKRFLSDGMEAGATAFVLPDLPFDYDEGVYDAARELGTAVMPVMVTSSRPDRLKLLRAKAPKYIYVALRRGTTGERTEIGEESIAFLEQLRDAGGVVMAGFGISERSQIVVLEPHVDAVIVGSAFVRTVTANAGRTAAEMKKVLSHQIAELAGTDPGG